MAQEAFVKAYRSFRELRDRERFRAWLVRMTWRLAIDRQRNNRRREARDRSPEGLRHTMPSAKNGASFRQFRATNTMILKNGETGQFTTATDKVTGETVQIVTLTVMK